MGGGLGKVWLARHVHTQALGAIKLLPPDAPSDEHLQFQQETEILAEMDHPALARLLDHGEHEGAPFLVSTYAPGDMLEQRLRAGQPMSAERCLTLFADLAFGLAHAHGLGIHHRDIQAENIIIREDGWASLVDFGVAVKSPANRVSSVDEVVGTVSYLPPEVVAGGPQDPIKTDVYALGQVLYEALTGRAVFRGDPYGRLRRSRFSAISTEKRAARALDPGPAFSDTLRRVVQRATEPNPDERLASARLLAESLAKMLPRQVRLELARRSRGVAATEPWTEGTTAPRGGLTRHRRRRLWFGIVVGALITGMLLGVLGVSTLVIAYLAGR